MSEALERLSKAGVHYGVAKSRRHPSVRDFIFGQKQRVDVFDLEQTRVKLDEAKAFARMLGAERKSLLFIGGKPESHRVVKSTATRIEAPYAVGRWIGGTFTNWSEIKKRLARLEKLTKDRAAGSLTKYTKLERLRIDREIEKLETMYAGLIRLGEKLPDAIFVVDPKREAIAVREARARKISVIALANSDCDLSVVDFPIPGNDAAQRSIGFIVEEIGSAYEEGLREKPRIDAPRTEPAHAPIG